MVKKSKSNDEKVLQRMRKSVEKQNKATDGGGAAMAPPKKRRNALFLCASIANFRLAFSSAQMTLKMDAVAVPPPIRLKCLLINTKRGEGEGEQ
ncbi:hypothetical protein niasHT_010790 [Heterodera trifolii]|uniref:Uncharacterized protein n=1 Tax=Heterodera trifolii TaxID=157864 RepID=A0ABD2KV97_9BILA